MCLSNFHHAVMAGFSMIVFSFPVTFILAVIGWVIWRIFSSEINQLVACFLGLIIGLIMGAMLDLSYAMNIIIFLYCQERLD